MKISDIKSGQGKIEVEADVVSVSEPKEINKFGKPLKVATAILKDESGTVKFSLWNQDVDKVKAGDRIKVTNGYANEFNGEIQLTAGKFGKFEVIGKAKEEAAPVAVYESEVKEEAVKETGSKFEEDEDEADDSEEVEEEF